MNARCATRRRYKPNISSLAQRVTVSNSDRFAASILHPSSTYVSVCLSTSVLWLQVNAMLKALPGIANATVVCFLFFVIFAIVGLQQWRGALGYCTMAVGALGASVATAPGRTTPLNRTECTGTFIAVGVQCVELLPTEALTAACLRNGTMGARLNAT